MSESTNASSAPKGANAIPENVAAKAKAAAAEEGNPVFRMMGLPNFKAKLPSRNWMIFFGVTGSFAAAVIYDKYQTKRIRQKWCDLVSPIADQSLAPGVLPRRITIYLESQPADGLRNQREHFHEYIKPVLVAAAMDWDVVEGRKEGDVRFGTAERIRKFRRRRGEGAGVQDEEPSASDVVETLRDNMGTPREAGPAGDLIVGRHTWKEYVRGLHEGWLGPVNKPEELPQESTPLPIEALTSEVATTAAPSDDASPTAAPLEQPAPEEAKKEEEKPKRPSKPEPYIATSAYSSSQLPSSIPQEFAPITILPVPHILGFWNFPIRIYRFLNRRVLTDDIGRKTAALILASSRPVDSLSELETPLEHEEQEWHKSVRKQDRSDGKESVWLDSMVIDERIRERMRVFELTRDDEEMAEQLFNEPRSEKKDDE